MKARWTTCLSLALLALWIIFTSCAVLLAYVNGTFAADTDLASTALMLVTMTALITVGTMSAAHRPGNPLGWIFLFASLAFIITPLADEYALYITATAPGSLPELSLFFWIQAWVWIPAFFLPTTFGILLFPTGRLPSQRWRPFAWLSGLSLSCVILAGMLKAGPMFEPPDTYPQLTNPIGIESATAVFSAILTVGPVALIGIVLGSVASIFSRLKTGTDRERLQIKWFAYAAVVLLAGFCLYLLLLILPVTNSGTTDAVGGMAVTLGIGFFPVAMGIAILRHNLYDIDHLINRTLVYGSLTALLVLGFAGTVVLFQLILASFTSGNDLAVAGSTLVVFVLIRPLRERLQTFVDRRFYRQKYDTERVLQDFGAKVRDDVNLEALSSDVTDIVATTLQPEHVSLWLQSLKDDSRLTHP